MVTTRQQLLGWLEHCERSHPNEGTHFPHWLCSMDAVHEAEADGDIEVIGDAHFHGSESIVIYGLTRQGRQKFYASLPRAGAAQVS